MTTTRIDPEACAAEARRECSWGCGLVLCVDNPAWLACTTPGCGRTLPIRPPEDSA